MPNKRRKILRRILYFFGGLLLLILLLFAYLVWISKVNPPEVADKSSLSLERSGIPDGLLSLKNNWFRKSNSGLYEMYVEGSPFERGVINGKLSKELVVKQEDYFNEQINKMIPSKFYLHFLKYFVGWFNRNLDKNITEEYKEEIYGVSESASDQYGYIGSKYQRILNYHAAHDIGHALQNLALVGCTSFGTWDSKSADGSMIIGRNFDFYVGDKFSKDKIVAFIKPASGYKFMSITWGGFIGVVSGMNEKGLTVTINADKSTIPTGSATPVSLVAREILQYAANIKDAIDIAKKRKMFVSESFLIASAADRKAIIIEKTPDSLDIYDPHSNQIICANHFQSKSLGNTTVNKKWIQETASAYRYQRLAQLLNDAGKNTVEKTIDILRDHGGMNNADIGLGNEKSVNQFISHHAIVFEPEKGKVWVSTAPWQLGKFVCYDLNKVFALAAMRTNTEIIDSPLTIPSDSFLLSEQFKKYTRYLQLKQEYINGNEINVDSLIADNPEYYHAYVIAGDYFFKQKNYEQARIYYSSALTKEIASKKEEDYIKKHLAICEGKINKK